jgi:hypothetical protein
MAEKLDLRERLDDRPSLQGWFHGIVGGEFHHDVATPSRSPGNSRAFFSTLSNG